MGSGRWVTGSIAEQAMLDRIASISVRAILKEGILLTDDPAQNPEFVISAKRGRAVRRFASKVAHSTARITFLSRDRRKVKAVEIDYYEDDHNAVAYCSVSGAITEQLYFVGDNIVCDLVAVETLTQADTPASELMTVIERLEGTDERGPARGATRERLLKTLQNGAFGSNLRAVRLLNDAAKRTLEPKKRLRGGVASGPDSLDPAAGLNRGGQTPSSLSDILAREAFEAGLVEHANQRGAGLPQPSEAAS